MNPAQPLTRVGGFLQNDDLSVEIAPDRRSDLQTVTMDFGSNILQRDRLTTHLSLLHILPNDR